MFTNKMEKRKLNKDMIQSKDLAFIIVDSCIYILYFFLVIFCTIYIS